MVCVRGCNWAWMESRRVVRLVLGPSFLSAIRLSKISLSRERRDEVVHFLNGVLSLRSLLRDKSPGAGGLQLLDL